MLLRLALSLTLLASPLRADDGPGFDPAPILACLAQGKEGACIGLGAEACMVQSPGGGTTMVQAYCAEAEHQWWDGELNRVYRQRMAEARTIDAEPPYPGMLPRPSDVDALRAMQRAWIAFRDATCHFEEIQWWGGTGMSGAGAGCRLRLTATQTLYLRSLSER